MVEHKYEDGIVYVTFNKPEKRNVFTSEEMRGLESLIKWINSLDDVIMVVFRGKGPVFCAGFDINDFLPSMQTRYPFYDVFPKTLLAIRDIKCPTLAVLHGPAFGFGCGVAMSCDFRIAKRGVTVALPTAKLGFCFSPNEILSLSHKMGVPLIKDMLLAARDLDADRAYQLGIVSKVVDTDEELEQEILNYIKDLKNLAPLAVKFSKRAINHLLREQVPREDEAYDLYYRLFESEDFLEGQDAFLHKRKPNYKGK